MNKPNKRFLGFLMCVAIVGISACSTTTHRIGPSRAAMNNYGIESGDLVLVRYAKITDARSSSRSEQILITEIDESGISGVGENGKAVNVGYEEIFQIEFTKVGSLKRDSPTVVGAGKVLFVGACVLAAFGGGGCPST